MTFSRRRFLGSAAAGAAAVALLPKAGKARTGVRITESWEDNDIYALGAIAIEAAISAGASYADVRFSETRSRILRNSPPTSDSKSFGVGVRVLYNGFWGFYSSVVWTDAEMVRLAEGAVDQARANSRGKPRDTPLAPVSPVNRGEWIMPVKYDPFEIPIGEQLDVMTAYASYAQGYKTGIGASWTVQYSRTVRYFVSSEGSSWKQTVYDTGGSFGVSYRPQYSRGLGPGGASTHLLSAAGKGWEHISESDLYNEIPSLIEQAEESRHVVPVDVDRLEAVLSAPAIASMIGETIGGATQLDRAMGFEANAGGTSYINEPLEMLGSLKVASPGITLRGGRSDPGQLATVKWDDEGVEPADFELVKGGVLNDFHTNREQAEWLRPWYESQNRPVRSNGCAASETAKDITLQHMPNLTLVPDAKGPGFDEMVSNIKRGVAVMSLSAYTDQQYLNGTGRGAFREIVNGRLGRYITGAGTLFRSPEFWQNVEAVGKPSESMTTAVNTGKGRPYQRWSYSISAPPVAVKVIDIIDVARKA